LEASSFDQLDNVIDVPSSAPATSDTSSESSDSEHGDDFHAVRKIHKRRRKAHNSSPAVSLRDTVVEVVREVLAAQSPLVAENAEQRFSPSVAAVGSHTSPSQQFSSRSF